MYESVFKKKIRKVFTDLVRISETGVCVQYFLVMLRYCCMIHRLGEDASLHS